MMSAILQTKLYIPQIRAADLVARPRLLAQMDQALNRKLTLVAAPAGFGKTTLVGSWVAERRPNVAWVALDEQDNELSRFLLYVVTALQSAVPDGGRQLPEPLEQEDLPPLDALLTPLLNELGTVDESLVLVLEDYHVINTQVVGEAVDFLLTHLPPQLHLVMTSRIEPDLPLARLRVRRQLNEICADDLRFTKDEAVDFFQQVMGLALSDSQITVLEARTEGWVAGLQLAALSLQGRSDIGAFVANFAGSHRYIMDYLADEVLDSQPANIRSFLLRTSILDRFCADLCATILEEQATAVQRLLESLEEANLFIVPLDDQRTWYRYHHLFADLLGHRLEQEYATEVSTLQRRAAYWFADNNLLPEAIDHALASADGDAIQQIFVLAARESLISARFSQTLRWYAQVPEQISRQQPRLMLYWGWLHLFVGQGDEAMIRLSQAEQCTILADDREAHALQQGLLGFLAMHNNDPAQAIPLLADAQDLAPSTDHVLCNLLGMLLARAKMSAGDLEGGLQQLVAIIAASPAIGDQRAMLDAYSTLDGVFNQHGAIEETLAVAERLIDRFETTTDVPAAGMGWMYLALGQHAYYLNDLPTALAYLEKGVDLAAQTDEWMASMALQMELVRLYCTLGQHLQARAIISELRRQNTQSDTLLTLFVDSAELLLAVRDSDIVKGTAIAERMGLTPSAYISPAFDVTYLIYARLLLAQGAYQEADQILATVEQIEKDLGYTHRLVLIAVLQAICAVGQRDDSTVVSALERAVHLAAPLGYLRLFLDEDAVIASYLPHVRTVAPAFVDQLLKLYDYQQTQPSSPLIEPLSDREREVLQLIAHGNSNRAIGEQLIISVGTVKKHTANIFGKLGVNSRTEAVAKARELGLLP